MKSNYQKYAHAKRGQVVLVIILLFLTVASTIVFGIVSPFVSHLRSTSDFRVSKESFFLAEAAVEDSYYRIKNGLNLPSTNTITLGGNSGTAIITTTASGKRISSVGNIRNLYRSLELETVQGTGADFFYGVQTGQGGLSLAPGATIKGNIYSNGSVSGSNNASVTGSVVVAGTSTISDLPTVGGDAWGHIVSNSTITGAVYCSSGSGNNKICDTSRGDAPAQSFVITDADILSWKADAVAGGTLSGNQSYGSSASLGPKKITGNLTVSGNGTILTMNGTLWVQGNLLVDNKAKVQLASGYGTAGGVIVVDGTITISNNALFAGSGQTGSYVLAVSTSTSANAVTVANNAGAVVLFAPYGTITFAANSTAKEASAYRIVLNNNATVEYESGLVDTHFSSGPSGGWNIESWKEVE